MMQEIFHFLKFQELSMNCEKYVFHSEKWNFELKKVHTLKNGSEVSKP